MIRTAAESHRRKSIGERFQKLVRSSILEKFIDICPWLSAEDITSCPMCKHGEDLKFTERLRMIFPVSIECKYCTTKGLKQVFDWYDDSVRNTTKLARVLDTIPILAMQRGKHVPLWVMSQDDALNLFHKLAELEEKLAELDGNKFKGNLKTDYITEVLHEAV